MNFGTSKKIVLDLYQNRYVSTNAAQYDIDSRELIVQITDDGKPYVINGTNIKVVLKYKKSDGKNVLNDCIVLEDGTVQIQLTDQMMASDGRCEAELMLLNIETEAVIHTMHFSVNIRKSVFSNEDVESTDEYVALEKALIKAEKVASNIEGIVEDAETAISQIEETHATIKANEVVRIQNEEIRQVSEAERQNNTTIAINNTNNAITNANTAITNVENATDAAVTATTNATKATQEANTVAEEMKALIANDNIIHKDKLGVAGGVATLDENGNIPASQLPSYVDDVLDGTYNAEEDKFYDLNGKAYTPESSKVYVDIEKRVTYRWSGSTYVDIGSSLALGETSSSAFAGDRGLALENRTKALEEYHNNIPASDIKFANTSTHITSANIQGAIEELSQEATQSKAGLLSAKDKQIIDNYSNIKDIEVALLANSWTGTTAPYTQIVTVSDLSLYNNCSVSLSENATTLQQTAAADADIDTIVYDESKGLIFTANGIKPVIDIPIVICVAASMNVVENPVYLNGDTHTASAIVYNGLTTKNVQDALDKAFVDIENLSDRIEGNQDAVEALEESVGKKANQTEVNNHINNSTVHITESERTAWNGVVSDLNNKIQITDMPNAICEFRFPTNEAKTEYYALNVNASSMSYSFEGVDFRLPYWNFDAKLSHYYIVANSNGAIVGYNLGCHRSAKPILITDPSNPSYFWIGMYYFEPNVKFLLNEISSNGLTVNANSMGTLSPSGGSDSYTFINLIPSNVLE